MAHRAGGEAAEQGRGLRVILILAALTLAEYIIAVALQSSPVALVALLTPVALVKAWAIVMYFMHLAKVWQGEGESA